MIFSYDHVDPEELATPALIDEGQGYFKVLKTENKLSNAGNPMLVLTLALKDRAGKSTICSEYITAKAAYKIHAILVAIGKESYYEQNKGSLNPQVMLEGKGRCEIVTDTPDNPKFTKRSVVAKYLPGQQQEAPVQQPATVEIQDDELPF